MLRLDKLDNGLLADEPFLRILFPINKEDKDLCMSVLLVVVYDLEVVGGIQENSIEDVLAVLKIDETHRVAQLEEFSRVELDIFEILDLNINQANFLGQINQVEDVVILVEGTEKGFQPVKLRDGLAKVKIFRVQDLREDPEHKSENTRLSMDKSLSLGITRK